MLATYQYYIAIDRMPAGMTGPIYGVGTTPDAALADAAPYLTDKTDVVPGLCSYNLFRAMLHSPDPDTPWIWWYGLARLPQERPSVNPTYQQIFDTIQKIPDYATAADALGCKLPWLYVAVKRMRDAGWPINKRAPVLARISDDKRNSLLALVNTEAGNSLSAVADAVGMSAADTHAALAALRKEGVYVRNLHPGRTRRHSDVDIVATVNAYPSVARAAKALGYTPNRLSAIIRDLRVRGYDLRQTRLDSPEATYVAPEVLMALCRDAVCIESAAQAIGYEVDTLRKVINGLRDRGTLCRIPPPAATLPAAERPPSSATVPVVIDRDAVRCHGTGYLCAVPRGSVYRVTLVGAQDGMICGVGRTDGEVKFSVRSHDILPLANLQIRPCSEALYLQATQDTHLPSLQWYVAPDGICRQVHERQPAGPALPWPEIARHWQSASTVAEAAGYCRMNPADLQQGIKALRNAGWRLQRLR